jgi:hypothetical protein
MTVAGVEVHAGPEGVRAVRFPGGSETVGDPDEATADSSGTRAQARNGEV